MCSKALGVSNVTQKISGLVLRLGVHSDRQRALVLARGLGPREREVLMHTIKTEIHVSDDVIWNMMLDIPWAQYPWWGICSEFDGYGSLKSLMVETHDLEGNSPSKVKVITTADVVAAINALPHAAHAWVSDELDSADIFDEVMQVAALGEVIYG